VIGREIFFKTSSSTEQRFKKTDYNYFGKESTEFCFHGKPFDLKKNYRQQKKQRQTKTKYSNLIFFLGRKSKPVLSHIAGE